MDPSTGLVFIGSHDQHIYALDIYVSSCKAYENEQKCLLELNLYFTS